MKNLYNIFALCLLLVAFAACDGRKGMADKTYDPTSAVEDLRTLLAETETEEPESQAVLAYVETAITDGTADELFTDKTYGEIKELALSSIEPTDASSDVTEESVPQDSTSQEDASDADAAADATEDNDAATN